jgi:hypothetical protein
MLYNSSGKANASTFSNNTSSTTGWDCLTCKPIKILKVPTNKARQNFRIINYIKIITCREMSPDINDAKI